MSSTIQSAPARMHADRRPSAPKAAPPQQPAAEAAVMDTAAHGDDDLMSQPATARLTPPTAAGRWLARVPAAQLRWPLISAADLVPTQGEPRSLSDLVRHRYGLTYGEALRQVLAFLASS